MIDINTVILGNSETVLKTFPDESIDLVFTSPPYYNARPEYVEYNSYSDYLLLMQVIIRECARVLSEGRFFVLNVSPVLVPRIKRSTSSKRLPIPFDFHNLFMAEGFDFIDDIIWVKPEGVGWVSGRGRGFLRNRTPLQYKPNPITEYILVYRKHTDKLIDWNIRKHPDYLVEQSKVKDGYEKTNVWKIAPARSKYHPAIFPQELAEKVIKYYSFKNDIVLDPFGGIGTTAMAAIDLDRRFVLIEKERKYLNRFKETIPQHISVDWRESVQEIVS